MPAQEAPLEELGSAPQSSPVVTSPTPSEASTASSPEPQYTLPTPLFRLGSLRNQIQEFVNREVVKTTLRSTEDSSTYIIINAPYDSIGTYQSRALAMPPPEPEQPPGQEELERRLPGYRRIIIPRELTLIELLKQDSGVTTDEEVLGIREVRLRVVAERIGLRRLHVLAPLLRSLTLDGSALSSLRDLGIGLVHLKILSVNRCGLNCLDGVWGLGALREFHAAGNRLHDLHPLGALQKLHTLNMADNPIEESTRLWTLGVCTSLRRLTLRGTPISEYPDYRTKVSTALPMLISLDDRPLHQDFQDESIGDASSSSDSEEDLPKKCSELILPPAESQPGPSNENEIPSEEEIDIDEDIFLKRPQSATRLKSLRRRPATTESAGVRPRRPNIPARPRTALARPTIDAPARLQILNTLMDEEWRCSGSKLTSHTPVCGNLARALRRPASARTRRIFKPEPDPVERDFIEQTMGDAARALAAEIPHAPRMEDWDKFREETGIDIKLDFERRTGDALSAIERLEQIEKETSDRLKNNSSEEYVPPPQPRFGQSISIMNDYEEWRDMNIGPIPHPSDINSLFEGITISQSDEPSIRSEVSLMSDPNNARYNSDG